MKREELKYWLALTRVKGIKPERLIEHVQVEHVKGSSGIAAQPHDVSSLFSPSSIMMQEAKGPLTPADWGKVERELDLIEKEDGDVQVVTINDAAYPTRLRDTPDPPPYLYIRGGSLDGERPAVAIIGTRRATRYSLSVAETLGRDLASAGVLIVSGMARGCDTAAHLGALKGALSSGFCEATVAVLGTGIDVTYPKENVELLKDITERGAVITEFPYATPPLAHNFPRRNRIISGLSMGVVVVEAPYKSGAVMTARLALEQGRDVFAVPGQVTTEKSAGSNKLLKDGAFLVQGAEDVLSVLKITGSIKEEDPEKDKVASLTLDALETSIIEALDGGPLHIDELGAASGLDANKVSTLLLKMELQGTIEQLPGKVFSKKY